MIALSVSRATLILGARKIFQDLNWEIHDDQKVGLIGPNGAGKSSLLKLIIEEYDPEPGGKITRAKGLTVGYLPQHPEFDPERTAISLLLEGNPRIAQVEQELNNIEARMSDPKIYSNASALERALTIQNTLVEEFQKLGGDGYAGRATQLLQKLGFPKADFEKPVSQLSGGQKKLIGLARLLLLQPTLLLLDEPDNHLDIPAKQHLETIIREYPGVVVLISHDRYLLDAVATHIVQIEDGKLSTFIGNYTDFILDKDQRLARQDELFQIQQRSIKRMELALKRYKLWVQISDKFSSRLHAMESRLAKVNQLEKPNLDRKQMGLELTGWRGSNQVLQLSGVHKSFESQEILSDENLLIRHGERVGLVGANGSGKSVLFRLIMGVEQPDLGEIIIGPSVKIGYYAQEHETLDFSQTLIESIRRTGNLTEATAVAILIRYLFNYQQATQKIETLSGGERSRLQLAHLVLSGANFLLLDEPTNNLDIAAAEVLENALSEFNGTVLVISHDRYFLDRTVDRIYSLKNGHLKEYLGGYSDFVAKSNSSK